MRAKREDKKKPEKEITAQSVKPEAGASKPNDLPNIHSVSSIHAKEDKPDLIQRFLLHIKAVKQDKEDIERGKLDPSAYYNPFEWTKTITVWSHVQLSLLIIFNAVIWSFVAFIQWRDYVEITVEPTLTEQMSSLRDKGLTEHILPITRFARDVTMTMNSHTFEAGPNLYMLRSTVSPTILQQKENDYKTNQSTIQRQGLIQSLTVTRVTHIIKTPNNKQFSCIVRGYLTHVYMPDGTRARAEPRAFPYRARLTLIRRDSKYDPYYLVQIIEASGQEMVKRFDDITED